MEATRCDDCKMVVMSEALFFTPEWFVVRDEVWAEAGMSTGEREYSGDGILCIGCLEKRLGRLLSRRDFAPVPLNDGVVIQQSRRLRNRLSQA